MKYLKVGFVLSVAALTVGCASNQEAHVKKAMHEQATMNRHVEKSALSRGAFCDGQGFRWYHEGANYIQFTCKDGSTFSLRKDAIDSNGKTAGEALRALMFAQ